MTKCSIEHPTVISNVEKHGFLSSVEAEKISFLLNKAAIFIFVILRPSFNFSRWLPIQMAAVFCCFFTRMGSVFHIWIPLPD